MQGNPAVFLMAYGTPRAEHEIEAYLTEIRRGQKPLPIEVEDLKTRYRKIGGSSPLLTITSDQASRLEKQLRSEGTSVRVYVGMKHWHPLIGDVIPQILAEGHQRIIALALAPHYSKMSIGGYKRALDRAVESFPNARIEFVECWYDHPLFQKAIAERISQALNEMPTSKRVHILFTAHSLPERIVQENDPYPKQLLESCHSVADLVNITDWSFAYQSAGQTGERWLGPDILEALEALSSDSTSEHVLVVPIGFVSDHLEVLYDIDVEAQHYASAHGMSLHRTASLNTHPTFIAALADIVSQRIGHS